MNQPQVIVATTGDRDAFKAVVKDIRARRRGTMCHYGNDDAFYEIWRDPKVNVVVYTPGMRLPTSSDADNGVLWVMADYDKVADKKAVGIWSAVLMCATQPGDRSGQPNKVQRMLVDALVEHATRAEANCIKIAGFEGEDPRNALFLKLGFGTRLQNMFCRSLRADYVCGEQRDEVASAPTMAAAAVAVAPQAAATRSSKRPRRSAAPLQAPPEPDWQASAANAAALVAEDQSARIETLLADLHALRQQLLEEQSGCNEALVAAAAREGTLQEQVTAIERELTREKRQQETMRELHTETQAQLEAARGRHEKLADVARAAAADVARLKDELDRTNAEVGDAENQLRQQYQQERTQARAQLDASVRERDALLVAHNAKVSELGQSRQALEAAEAATASSVAQLATERQTARELRERIGQHQRDLDAVKGALRTSEAQRTDLDGALRASTTDAAAANESVSVLTQRITRVYQMLSELDRLGTQIIREEEIDAMCMRVTQDVSAEDNEVMNSICRVTLGTNLRLKQATASLVAARKEMATMASQLAETLAAANASESQLRGAVEAATTEIAAYEERARALEAERARLRGDSAEARRRRAELDAELAEVRVQLNLTGDRLTRLTVLQGQCTATLDAMTLCVQTGTCDDQLLPARFQAAVAHHAAKMRAATLAAAEQAERDRAQIALQLADAHQKLKDLAASLEADATAKAELQRQFDEASVNAQSLAVDIRHLKQELQGIEGEGSRQRTERAALEANLADLRAEQVDVRVERERLQALLAKCDASRLVDAAALEASHAEVARQRALLDQLREEREQLRGLRMSAEARASALEAMNRDTREKLVTAHAETASLKKSLLDQVQSVGRLTQEKMLVDNELVGNRARMNELLEQVAYSASEKEALERELSKAVAEHQAVTAAIATLEQDRDRVARDAHLSREEQALARTRFDTHLAQLTAERSELTRARDQIQNLLHQCTTAQAADSVELGYLRAELAQAKLEAETQRQDAQQELTAFQTTVAAKESELTTVRGAQERAEAARATAEERQRLTASAMELCVVNGTCDNVLVPETLRNSVKRQRLYLTEADAAKQAAALQIATLTEAVTNGTAEKKHLDAEVAKVNLRVVELRSDIESVTDERDQLRGTHEEQRHQRQKLDAELAQLRKELVDAEARRVGLDQRIRSCEMQRAADVAAIVACLGDTSACESPPLDHRVADFARQFRENKERATAFKTQFATLLDELQQIKEIEAEHNKQIRLLEIELADERAAGAVIRQQNQAANAAADAAFLEMVKRTEGLVNVVIRVKCAPRRQSDTYGMFSVVEDDTTKSFTITAAADWRESDQDHQLKDRQNWTTRKLTRQRQNVHVFDDDTELGCNGVEWNNKALLFERNEIFYQRTVGEILKAILNLTLIAYGASGAGKSTNIDVITAKLLETLARQLVRSGAKSFTVNAFDVYNNESLSMSRNVAKMSSQKDRTDLANIVDNERYRDAFTRSARKKFPDPLPTVTTTAELEQHFDLSVFREHLVTLRKKFALPLDYKSIVDVYKAAMLGNGRNTDTLPISEMELKRTLFARAPEEPRVINIATAQEDFAAFAAEIARYRPVTATPLNPSGSSRSHLAIQIHHGQGKMAGKVTLVDLAGSESYLQVGALQFWGAFETAGVTVPKQWRAKIFKTIQEEAGHINSSLRLLINELNTRNRAFLRKSRNKTLVAKADDDGYWKSKDFLSNKSGATDAPEKAMTIENKDETALVDMLVGIGALANSTNYLMLAAIRSETDNPKVIQETLNTVITLDRLIPDDSVMAALALRP